MIQNSLVRLDFLSPPSTLLVNGRKLIKSQIGGVFTILITLASFILFLIYSIKVLDKENPSVVYNIEYKQYTNLTLIKDMIVAVGLVDNKGNSYKNSESLYTVYIHYKKLTPSITKGIMTTTTEEVNLNITRCTEESFGDKFDLFKNKRYHDYYCIDPNNNNPNYLVIANPFAAADTEFSQLFVYVAGCTNGTVDAVVCKSEEEIAEAFNLRNPLIPYSRKMSTHSSYSLYQGLTLLYKDIYYFDDEVSSLKKILR